MRRVLPTLGLLLTSLSMAQGADLLIRGAKVWPVSGDPAEPCDVLMREGKIAAIGANLPVPEGARVVEAAGKQVCPGFVDARSHLGLARHESDEIGGGFDTDICIAGASYWPERDEVQKAVSSGVTTWLLTPGTAHPLGGRCLLGKLGGPFPCGLPGVVQITLSQSAMQWNREPTSWPGLLKMLREALQKAKQADATGDLAAAVRGEMPVQFVCDSPVEAQQALALAREFGLKGSIFVTRPSVRTPEAVAGGNLTLVLPVLLTAPLNTAQSLPAALVARKVKVSFGSEAPYNEPADLRACAALAMAAGLPEAAALRTLTLDAAEALGVADRLGSLEVGKDADLLVLGGDPLDLQAAVEMAVVGGAVIYERGAKP